MSAPKVKFPLPTCMGVDVLDVLRVGEYRDTMAWRSMAKLQRHWAARDNRTLNMTSRVMVVREDWATSGAGYNISKLARRAAHFPRDALFMMAVVTGRAVEPSDSECQDMHDALG